MSFNPQQSYNPGALEGGAPPPYTASGPPPPYSQAPSGFSYPGGAAPSAPPPSAPGFQPPFPSGPPPQPGFQQGYQQPQGERSAIIRNVSTGLAMDGGDYDVKLQPYNGNPHQIWILEPLAGGKFIIRNKGSGAVLDIEGGPDCGANLITYEKHGGDNQQWFINSSDNTIVSAAANLAVDVCEGNCVPGNVLIAYDRHGGPNQQFQVQYQ